MSTSLDERLYARELRALYRATRQSAEPFTSVEIEALTREERHEHRA
jgi:hypothetical protein